MINLISATLQRGHKIILDQADLRIHPGWHMGLVGENGAGKTSVFKLLSQTLAPDSGDLEIPGGWRIGLMEQEIQNPNISLLDYVLDGHKEYRSIQSRIELAQTRGNDTELSKNLSALEDIQGYEIPSIAARLLNGLGFPQIQHNNQMSEFSGGWQIRANLARTLLQPSDLLLLDEPTNHLDLDAILWLEQWLIQYPGTLIIISHDREFLDTTCQHIVQIHDQKLNYYRGNYSQFENQQAAQLAQQQVAYEKQQASIAHMENFVRRFKAKATKAKQAQSRVKALERMEKIAPAHISSPFNFKFAQPEKVPTPILKLEEAELGYQSSAEQVSILSQCDLRLEGDERIALIGPNGAGKSTLVKSLVGSIKPIQGSVWRHEHCQLGYFEQNQLAQLDLSSSALTHLQRIDSKSKEQSLRDFLGGFNFKGDKATDPITHFSGGEKCRLVLALIVWQKPNILVLDEPTNHLDLEMREALCLAMQEYTGALILVSHDRHLVRTTCDTLYLVAEGSMRAFEGDLDDYGQWLKQYRSDNKASENSVVTTSASSPATSDRKGQRRQTANIRKQLAPLKRSVDAAEKRLDKLQSEQSTIEAALADNSIYEDSNKSKLLDVLGQQANNSEAINNCESQWLELAEDYEKLSQELNGQD